MVLGLVVAVTCRLLNGLTMSLISYVLNADNSRYADALISYTRNTCITGERVAYILMSLLLITEIRSWLFLRLEKETKSALVHPVKVTAKVNSTQRACTDAGVNTSMSASI